MFYEPMVEHFCYLLCVTGSNIKDALILAWNLCYSEVLSAGS